MIKKRAFVVNLCSLTTKIERNDKNKSTVNLTDEYNVILKKTTGAYIINIYNCYGPCFTFNVAKSQMSSMPVINVLVGCDEENECTIDIRWDKYIEARLSNKSYSGEYFIDY